VAWVGLDAFRPLHIPLAAWLREMVDAQSLMHEAHPMALRFHSAVGGVWADEDLLEVARLRPGTMIPSTSREQMQ